jgi:hypothetical protein
MRSEEASAAGVLVFHLRRVFGDYYQAGRLFGGDAQSYYTGDYRVENGGLKGHFDVVDYGGDPNQAFGPGDSLTVTFSAVLDPQVERDVLLVDARRADTPDEAFRLRLTKRAAFD